MNKNFLCYIGKHDYEILDAKKYCRNIITDYLDNKDFNVEYDKHDNIIYVKETKYGKIEIYLTSHKQYCIDEIYDISEVWYYAEDAVCLRCGKIKSNYVNKYEVYKELQYKIDTQFDILKRIYTAEKMRSTKII